MLGQLIAVLKGHILSWNNIVSKNRQAFVQINPFQNVLVSYLQGNNYKYNMNVASE